MIRTTDTTGTTAATYAYGPYGVQTSAEPPSTMPNPWRFASGYYDVNTHYLKFRTRYYDPTLGRWTQRDPSGQAANPYAYASNDPVDNVDPTGRLGFSFTISYTQIYLNSTDLQALLTGIFTFAGGLPGALEKAALLALAGSSIAAIVSKYGTNLITTFDLSATITIPAYFYIPQVTEGGTICAATFGITYACE